MKKFLLSSVGAVFAVFAAFAFEDVVTVKASIEATSANTRVKSECSKKAQKLAVQKFLGGLDADMAETIVQKAMKDYKKYIDEVDDEDGDFEDGEFSCEYKVTIKREELLQWLGTQGWSMASSNSVDIDIVVAEDPPDVGSMKVADAFGTGLDGANFFFTRYTEFQKTIRDALVDQLNKIGIQAPLLEDNPAYEELKSQDPCCLGVYFDPGVGDKGGFKITPNYLKLVQGNNPDSMVLYYRVGSLIFEAAQRKVFVNVSLSIKNLSNNKTIQIGRADEESPTITSGQKDRIMMEMATTVCSAMGKILNGEDAGQKIIGAIKTLKSEAARPQGPMKVVINGSSVDKKIRDDFLLELEDGIVAAGLCKEKDVKSVGNTVTCVITSTDPKMKDPRRLWRKLKEVLTKAGLDDEMVTDDIKTVNGNTMTVTPGK